MRSPRIFIAILIALLLAMAGGLAYLYWQNRQPKESPYDPLIVKEARESGVDPFLIRALIWRESHFNPLTYGLAHEHGLMQVTPEAGEIWAKANKVANFKPDDLFDPETNIQAGTWYPNRGIKRWSQTDDPIPFALAEYNAGRSNALKWVDPTNPQDHLAFMDRINFPTTRKYVEDILEKRDEYRAVLGNNRWYREFGGANSSVTESR